MEVGSGDADPRISKDLRADGVRGGRRVGGPRVGRGGGESTGVMAETGGTGRGGPRMGTDREMNPSKMLGVTDGDGGTSRLGPQCRRVSGAH